MLVSPREVKDKGFKKNDSFQGKSLGCPKQACLGGKQWYCQLQEDYAKRTNCNWYMWILPWQHYSRGSFYKTCGVCSSSRSRRRSWRQLERDQREKNPGKGKEEGQKEKDLVAHPKKGTKATCAPERLCHESYDRSTSGKGYSSFPLLFFFFNLVQKNGRSMRQTVIYGAGKRHI